MSDGGRPAELFQLDRSTCVALLGVHHVGRLIIPGDDPYVIPVNYTAIDGHVLFRTERRAPIDEIVGRPVVFEVDMFDDGSRSGWSVVVRGIAADVTAESDLEQGTSSGAVPQPWAPGDRSCVIRITTDGVTGRLLRGAVAPASHGDEAYL